MSGSSYVGHYLSIFVRAPRLWEHHHHGQGRADQLRRAGRAVAQSGDPGRPRALPFRRAAASRISMRPRRSMPSACSRRWSASRCRTSSSRSAAGPPATWCPTAIGRTGLPRRRRRPSQSSGLRARAQYRPRRCGRSRPGSSRPRWRAGAAAACSIPTRSSAIRSGVRNVGHASMTYDTDRDAEPASRDRATTPPRARRRAAPWARRSCARRPPSSSPTGSRSATATIPRRSAGRTAGPAPPLTISEYHPTSYPGSRAPHAWLAEGRSIIDAFGARLYAAALRR